jgi:hypothetical protein
MTGRIFAYGRVTLAVYAYQDDQRFYVKIGHDSLGMTATKRAILWTKAPKRRGARKWFREHAAKHRIELVFDQ